MEQRARRWFVLALGTLALGALGFVVWSRKTGTPRVVPEGVRIRVEVLNASGRRGHAYRATVLLRQAGFDVVRFASDTATADSTIVLVRTAGESGDWASKLVAVLGVGSAVFAPDSSLYLDLTVRLGRDWRPPVQPFYP